MQFAVTPVDASSAPPPAVAFVDALLRHDMEGAKALVRSLVASETPLDTVYANVLGPALYEVGRRWERGELTVPQEHYCTAATLHVMAELREQAFQKPRTGKRLIALAVGGNFHSVGIRMIADVFEVAGWDTTYLGTDVMTEAVVAALSTPHDMVAISAALEEHVPRVAALIAKLRQRGLTIAPILVGGRPFNAREGRWREVGADGFAATPQGALVVAEQLLVQRAPRAAHAPRAMVTVPPRPAPDPEEQRGLAAMSSLNNQLHDLTRTLGERNAELARLNAQINRMMGVAAHDLRNPLSVVAMNAQLLSEDLDAVIDDDQRAAFREIMDAGRFMKVLLDDLLDVSRIRTGMLELRLGQHDLGELVRTAVSANQPIARRKQIALRVTAPDAPLPHHSDAAKLRQVVNNLVGNAIQYSMPETTVDVVLAATADSVTLEVRDRGKGIPAQELARVFQPFVTTSTRGTAGEKSTGLGLAIVQSIVEAHGGRVTVESTLGEGARFVVSLPR